MPDKATLNVRIDEGLVTLKFKNKQGILCEAQFKAMTNGRIQADIVNVPVLVTSDAKFTEDKAPPEPTPNKLPPEPPKPAATKKKSTKKASASDFDPPSSDDE